jgi:hypothetical protein
MKLFYFEMLKITIWTNFKRSEELLTRKIFQIPIQGKKGTGSRDQKGTGSGILHFK